MHMAFLSRVFKNLQWYGMTHAASILCLRRVFSVIYKISSRPRATSSSSSAPSRKRKKRMANSSRSPESTLLR